MSKLIRVLLTDDHAVVRAGVRRLLEQYSGIEVVAEAESGEQAYQMYAECLPSVLVMDVSMPGMGGLESLRRIMHRYPSAKVVMFSMHATPAFARHALEYGASGYVVKTGDTDDLVNAVLDAVKGKSYLSAEVAHNLALQGKSGGEDPTQKLTAREFEVFRLLAEGRVVEEIAILLNISQKTASNYQTTLKQKLGLTSPVSLVRMAIRYGVIEG